MAKRPSLCLGRLRAAWWMSLNRSGRRDVHCTASTISGKLPANQSEGAPGTASPHGLLIQKSCSQTVDTFLPQGLAGSRPHRLPFGRLLSLIGLVSISCYEFKTDVSFSPTRDGRAHQRDSTLSVFVSILPKPASCEAGVVYGDWHVDFALMKALRTP